MKSPPRLAALIECCPPVGNDDDLPGSEIFRKLGIADRLKLALLIASIDNN